jgi:hypothetical protein
MPTFPLSSPSYSQQVTRFDVACDGETVTNSPLTLLIMFATADEAAGVGSERLNDSSPGSSPDASDSSPSTNAWTDLPQDNTDGSLDRTTYQAKFVLACDPFQRFALFAFVIGSHFGMHEQPNCTYDPMLPVMASDDGYALHSLLVLFYEADVPFESRHVFPTRKIRRVNQQSYSALLPDERTDLPRQLIKIASP